MIRTIRLRDLIKYLVGLISVILIAIYSTRYFSGFKNSSLSSLFNIDYESILKSNIIFAYSNKDLNEELPARLNKNNYNVDLVGNDEESADA